MSHGRQIQTFWRSLPFPSFTHKTVAAIFHLPDHTTPHSIKYLLPSVLFIHVALTWLICISFVLFHRSSFGGRDSRPPPPSRRDRSSSAERSSERDGSAVASIVPPSLLDLPKIPPPAVQEASDRNPHATESHQGPLGPRFQSPRGPPGPGKNYLSLTPRKVSLDV